MTNVYNITLENLGFVLDRLTKAHAPGEFVEISDQFPGWRPAASEQINGAKVTAEIAWVMSFDDFADSPQTPKSS